MRKRRYEILLPLTHNDGRPVSPEKFQQTRDELFTQFSAISFVPQPIRGIWLHGGTRYEDESLWIFVDVDDTPENDQFFIRFKAALLERFEQIEIYMVWFLLERI